jgi:uncharacterized protein involved in outer membrane biogenesis
MLKKLLIGFTGLIVLIFLAIAGVMLFFPFESFIKERIKENFGANVSINKIHIGWGEFAADDIIVKTSAGTDFLKVKKAGIDIAIIPLLSKKVIVNDISIDSPAIIVKRTKGGQWLLPAMKNKKPAVDKKEKSQQYEIFLKKFNITNGSLQFVDDMKGAKISATDFVLNLKSKAADKTKISSSAKISSGGKINLQADGNMIAGNLKGELSLENFDIGLIETYLISGLDIKKGRAGFNTKFNTGNWYVKAPSELKMNDLDIGTKNSIMGVSAPQAKGLMKKEGEIAINFNIWGKPNNLQNDFKEVFQKKVSAEAGKVATKIIEKKLGKELEKFLSK